MSSPADPEPPIEVNVVLDADGRAHADETLAALEGAGVEVLRYRRVLGIVFGRLRATQVTTVQALRGVAAVEPDRPVGLLQPPQSDP